MFSAWTLVNNRWDKDIKKKINGKKPFKRSMDFDNFTL